MQYSPIHFAEKHYQKYYHLRFAHAKKLFVFDLTLLATILFLIGATLFWFLYNPGISDLISLTISPSKEKIQSGEYVTYTINYRNNSEEKLVDPTLSFVFPDGFIPEKDLDSFKLKDLAENKGGSMQVSGWSFGEPNKEERITVELTYKQAKRNVTENKITSLLQTHRDSVLKAGTTEIDTIINQGEKDLQITLVNTGEMTLPEVILPLQIGTGLELVIVNPAKGTVENKTWHISNLAKDDQITLDAKIKSTLSPGATSAEIKITPNIKINQNNIPQKTLSKVLKVIHPKVTILTEWSNLKTHLNPGETADLKLVIKNKGNIDLQNLNIEIPIPANLIDVARLTDLNHGVYKNQTFVINKNFATNLGTLLSGQETDLTLIIPTNFFPTGGTDLNLKLNPKVTAILKKLDTTFETKVETPAVKIATALKLNAEIRYYTAEGDQLGRGPIPPKTGEETKYWALLTLVNGSSQVQNLRLTAVLPEYVVWTGKSSVGAGLDVKYTPENKTVTWVISSIPAQEEVGVNFELSLTPSMSQIGTTPTLLKNINFTGFDTFVETNIQKTHSDLDASLPTDEIAKEKGIEVE